MQEKCPMEKPPNNVLNSENHCWLFKPRGSHSTHTVVPIIQHRNNWWDKVKVFYLMLSDVLYPTLTGCLFSWLVSTTHQDAMALFWTVSHVMNSTEGTDGKQFHECPLYTKKEKYWQPIPGLRLQQWSL